MKPLNNYLSLKIYICILSFIIFSCTSSDDETHINASDFIISIDENPESAQLIGTINASTNQGELTYTLIQQLPEGAFTVENATGKIIVANESLFDYELNPLISGIVHLENGSISKEILVSIHLNDIEEQNIFEGDVVLNSQEDVDSFGSNFYTHITGILHIETNDPNNLSSPISNLSPLSSITSVGSNLLIYKNLDLINLNGLENISNVNGYIYIVNNFNLKVLNGFNNLKEIGGLGLIIEVNYQVDEFSAFQNLERVNGLFQIMNINNAEINLDKLQFVGSDFGIFNSNLTNFSFNQLTHISGAMRISYVTNLTNLDGLSSLSNLGNLIHISGNTSLIDFCGLNTLLIDGNFNGNFVIHENAYNPTEQDIINGNCSQ